MNLFRSKALFMYADDGTWSVVARSIKGIISHLEADWRAKRRRLTIDGSSQESIFLVRGFKGSPREKQAWKYCM